MSNDTLKFNLEDRTAKLGENVIIFCKKIKYSNISDQLIKQIIRSSTSVGANYMEANSASSRKDFKNKIHISKKEASETKHWLRMLATSEPELKDEIRVLWQEAHELSLIFHKITSTLSKKNEN